MSKELSKNESDLDLFSMFPEGTRIFIDGKTVTFENLTEDLLEVAESLNPDDPNIRKRMDNA